MLQAVRFATLGFFLNLHLLLSFLNFAPHSTTVDNGVVQEKKHALQSLEEAASEKQEAISKLRAEETALRNEHEALTQRKVNHSHLF
jgi:hypothetical protein